MCNVVIQWQLNGHASSFLFFFFRIMSYDTKNYSRRGAIWATDQHILPIIMAFSNRFGSVLKHTISLNNLGNGQIATASMLGSIRFFSNKLFVGGLSWGTNESSLREAFSSHGDVTEARIINDRETGRSRGFGFVSFATEESANSAMSAMDGQELDGRNIRVTVANDRAPRGGGYGGGYGGNPGFNGPSGANDY
ncbi:Glycine-rich RNA-binding protein 4, mitochondrial-like protein [Drosera capensis]